MKNKLLIILALTLNCGLYAQNSVIQSHLKEGMYTFNDTLKIMENDLFNTYFTDFGLTKKDIITQIASSNIDSTGFTSSRYQQYNQGYLVEGPMMNVISKLGVVLYINGFVLPNFTPDTSNHLSEADALNAALQNFVAPKYAWQDKVLESVIKYVIDTGTGDTTIDSSRTYYPKGQLVFARPYDDTATIHDTANFALCWKFSITPMYWDTVVIDTNTIDSLPHYDTIIGYRKHHCKMVYINAKTGKYFTTDPNEKFSFYTSEHINPTYYNGNQLCEVRTCTFGCDYQFTDHRQIHLEADTAYYYGDYYNHYNAISTKLTSLTAYWELEMAYDYFQYRQGFLGTTAPPSVNTYPIDIFNNVPILTGMYGSSFEWQASYDFHTVGSSHIDEFNIGADDGTIGSDYASAAHLDIMGHEYTHAIIEHGPHLDFGVQAQAMQEAFCDFYGTQLENYVVGSTTNWTDGFGHSSSRVYRHFDNPNLDILTPAPYPSAAEWEDPYPGAWDVTNKWRMSGLMRHFLGLIQNSGSFRGYYINNIDPQRDAFVSMYWWMWDGSDYRNAISAFLGWYELKYGKCSFKYIQVLNAWRSIISWYDYPDCSGKVYIGGGPKVINPNQLGFQPGNPGGSPQFSVKKNDTTNKDLILSYRWQIPKTWVVSFSADSSQITIVQLTNNSSQIVSCVVTYADSTTDSVSDFLHIVGDVVTPKGVLAVTEISQGPANATDCEYAEILVANCGTDSSNYVDVRGWIIDDNSGNFDVAGCVTGKGITSGHYRLSNNEFWKFIPVGSKIVVYNGDANCYNLPDTFSIDNVNNIYWLPVPKQAQAGYLLQQYDGTENANICTYCSDTGKNIYKAARNWVATLDLDANHDAIQVRCPGCTIANPGDPDFYHGIGYANKAAGFAAIPPTNDDLGAALIVNKTAGPYKYEFVGSSVADFGNASMWLVYQPDTAGARPYTIGRVKDNLAYNTQNHLLNLPCCAGNKGGRKAQPGTTAIDNNPTITVYPNPAHTVINFALSQTGDAQVDIMNITGQLVHTLHISNNSIGTLNVTNLAKGLYIYKAVTNNKTQTGKIVIE